MITAESVVLGKNGKKYSALELSEKDAQSLSRFLQNLSVSSKKSFHPHPFGQRFIRKYLTDNKGIRVSLADVQNGKIVAYSFINPIIFSDRNGYFGIVVGDKYQGLGLGKALTELMLKLSRKKGYKKIILNVYSDNLSAIGLYKKLGFIVFRISSFHKYLVLFSEILRNSQVFKSFLNIFLRRRSGGGGSETDNSIWMYNLPA